MLTITKVTFNTQIPVGSLSSTHNYVNKLNVMQYKPSLVFGSLKHFAASAQLKFGSLRLECFSAPAPRSSHTPLTMHTTRHHTPLTITLHTARCCTAPHGAAPRGAEALKMWELKMRHWSAIHNQPPCLCHLMLWLHLRVVSCHLLWCVSGRAADPPHQLETSCEWDVHWQMLSQLQDHQDHEQIALQSFTSTETMTCACKPH